ncbi:MAG: YccF domain-containing protein [Ilumatobacter sp.]
MNRPPQPTYVTTPAAAGRSGALHVIGNILWFVLAGLWMGLGYIVAGIVQCITIIGIPFGLQSFKLAGYAFWPFGRVVYHRTDRSAGLSCVGNVIWIVLSGFWLALGHVFTGILLCITIIGIPFGIASFKLAGLALVPFGKTVVTAGQPLPPEATVYLAL